MRAREVIMYVVMSCYGIVTNSVFLAKLCKPNANVGTVSTNSQMRSLVWLTDAVPRPREPTSNYIRPDFCLSKL